MIEGHVDTSGDPYIYIFRSGHKGGGGVLPLLPLAAAHTSAGA